MDRACSHCAAPLPAGSAKSRKFCDAECRTGKKPLAAAAAPDSLVAATEVAIAAARAAKTLGPADEGAIAALRALARKIDAWDTIVDWALDDARENESRPTVPANDNVSLPTYLKFCESLGLTPAGRSRMVEKKPEAQRGGKLGKLQSVPKPA